MSLKKIECIEYLFKKLKCRSEILQFLVDENLLTSQEMAGILHDPHHTHSSAFFSLLSGLQKEEKIQLVDYEWTVLPKEFVKLTIVTMSAKKEFTYSV